RGRRRARREATSGPRGRGSRVAAAPTPAGDRPRRLLDWTRQLWMVPGTQEGVNGGGQVVVPERRAGEPREPKYYSVKRPLLEIIGTLTPGSPVPTERLLMAQLGTSRTTVRQALAELVGEGRLVRRQGSGTYVAEPKVSWPLRMTSFTEQAS